MSLFHLKLPYLFFFVHSLPIGWGFATLLVVVVGVAVAVAVAVAVVFFFVAVDCLKFWSGGRL